MSPLTDVDLAAIGEEARRLVLRAPVLGEIQRQFSAQGHEVFLVGGGLRDVLRGLPFGDTDIDLATEARPETTQRLLRQLGWPVYDVGKRYGTIGARHGEGVVEVTTFRHDVYRGDDRHPEVTFGDSIEEDLVRRDLTINSMALNLASGPLIDPAGGVEDLRRRRIRVTGDPAQRFLEDPLRLMRVVRFGTQLDFRVDEATQTAVRAAATSLATISGERIRDELNKILLSQHAAYGLRLLVELDLMAQFAPAIDDMKRFTDEAKQARFKNLLTHTLQVVEHTPRDLAPRLAGLLHDVGKPRTFSVTNGQVHFFEHERVGATIARQLLTDLHYDAHTIKEVVALIQGHMRPASDTDTWTDSAVRRFVREIGEERLEGLFALARADVTSSNPRKVSGHMARLERLIERSRAAIADMHAVKPESPIDGAEIMAMTGLRPGPAIGQIKSYLLNLVLDGDLAADDKEGAATRMREFMAEQGISADPSS